MTGEREVLVQPGERALAERTAADLLARLVTAQSARGVASVVLTGGGIGIAVLDALRMSAGQADVDWSRVDVWWGDERFVPATDDERNEGQARRALLDHVPLDPDRVRPMPPSDGPYGDDVDAAAAVYAEQLRAAAAPGSAVPSFDVLLLGMGPEGHTASIFPHSPATVDARPVFGVRDCPKPPPTRISLGFEAINAAREIWVVVAGEEKAAAVTQALAGADRTDLPVAAVRGTELTRWLLDEAAASAL